MVIIVLRSVRGKGEEWVNKCRPSNGGFKGDGEVTTLTRCTLP